MVNINLNVYKDILLFLSVIIFSVLFVYVLLALSYPVFLAISLTILFVEFVFVAVYLLREV
jgi:hypothetical protein